ncbi:MAG TPA: phosphate ABC transporter ATP-binding protein [Nitrospinota bacterium]|nr:phosphate ABC transporter ATP-binding protein [Nitrospinota bacterium]|tara:strand:- start:311377 stop:312153 length:777 start_codon:yes stop_codon:yes gene_type:complete
MEVEKKALVTKALSITYPNGVEGCKKVSIAVARNEVTAIIGPSGCGKSTFLKSLNRLNDEFGCVYEGSILLADGTNVLALNQYELCLLRGERVGYVMQKPVPFSGKTIRQDVTMPLRGINVTDKDEVNEKLRHALTRAALWDEVKDRLDNLSTSLSGGQQQRLCVARAIINAPEILLLDEPCSSLDPKATQLLESMILDLALDHTVIIVTHNMQQAQRVAARTAFLYEGELVEYDMTENIFSKPSEKLTRDYIVGKFS